MPHSEATPLPTYKREAKRATQDGYIWPFARGEMRNPQAICERMAEDLRAMLQARGAGAVITTEDYLRLGWHREQVQKHGLAASGLLRDMRQDRARDLANEVA